MRKIAEAAARCVAAVGWCREYDAVASRCAGGVSQGGILVFPGYTIHSFGQETIFNGANVW
jgi:hypothetical protein